MIANCECGSFSDEYTVPLQPFSYRLCSRIPVSQILYSLSEVKTPRHLLLAIDICLRAPLLYTRVHFAFVVAFFVKLHV